MRVFVRNLCAIFPLLYVRTHTPLTWLTAVSLAIATVVVVVAADDIFIRLLNNGEMEK